MKESCNFVSDILHRLHVASISLTCIACGRVERRWPGTAPRGPGIELGVQPGFGRRPLECHWEHHAAAGVPPARLAQVGLDVGRQGDLDVIGGVRTAIVDQNARRHRPGAHRLAARLQVKERNA